MRQRPLSMLFAAEITDRALLAQVVIESGRVFGQRVQMSAEHFDPLHQRMLFRYRAGGAQLARQLFILRRSAASRCLASSSSCCSAW